MSTVPPSPMRPVGATTTAARRARPLGATLIAAAAIVIILLALIRLFGHHQNKYEKMAFEVTQAIQNNNMAPVAGLFNAQTRDRFTKVRVARASDDLAPLGKVKSVKETTGANAPPNGHSFDVTGERGTAHEQIVLDSDGKIVSFHYLDVAPSGK